MIFLGLDVSKFRNFLNGFDLRSSGEDHVRPLLLESGSSLFLGVYIDRRVSLEDCNAYSREIQSWLKNHCLSGVAYHGDHSKGYELVFLPREGKE